MAGGKWRPGLLPLLMVLVGALTSGMLVAWRRLDATGPRNPRLYEPQVFYDRNRGSSLASGAPYKTLVIYVYHERCAPGRSARNGLKGAGARALASASGFV